MTTYHRAPAEYRNQRPAPALCIHCHYLPARLNKRWPHLATNWCSDTCRANFEQRLQRDKGVKLAEDIRSMLGLPGDRSWTFTVPELEAMARRLRRLLPYDGLAMYPARKRRAEGMTA